MRISFRNLVATWTMVLITATCATVNADIVYSGGIYSQSFDTLASSGTGVAWANDSTLSGWSLFESTGSAITAYNAGTGSSTTGSFYSFGTTGERALGGVGAGTAYFGSPVTGAVAGHMAVQITNNTGLTIDSFTIGFDGEQWRDSGSASAQSMFLEYGFGNTFAGVSVWNAPGGNFDWASVVNGSAGAVDGNVAGLVAGRGGTIGSLAWGQGDSLWIRWVETNDTGADHGLAIDNVTFSATTVIPEPGSFGLVSLIAVGSICFGRRRRL